MFPEEPYHMWAADKALMHVFAAAEYLGVIKIVPSNNNIFTGFLLSLLDEK